ncbi:ERCC4 domain-containing protein [Desulfobacca acetoxidans]|uniref:ERCC4 domain protein n=1 Tax=Desulfobacca acetoxidans (strain ATCC 700848 / DSM 11109 / ASRB2) TaxID=880072 RepID=F2NG10_DESAR|nr:ERCC4 domain protein [Desulfobacca acetoxidans DSM 11109]
MRLNILVDTREQVPFSFGGYDVAVEPAALPVGDYSLPGFVDRVAIERKELNDLIACLMDKNRDRFERELAKGKSYELFAVVVEAALEDVRRGDYRSAMKPHAALQSLCAFQVRYRVPFVWAGDRQGAEYMTFSLLAKYLREIEERYKQAVKGGNYGKTLGNSE